MRPETAVCALVLALWAARVPAQAFICAGTGDEPVGAGPAGKPAALLPERLYPQGRLEALVIFAGFADEAHLGDDVPGWVGSLFDPDLPGSLRHFYRTMSFGQLEVRGTVLTRRYVSDQPGSAYTSTDAAADGGYGRWAAEILRKVDAEVDLGLFDNDGGDGRPNSGDDDGVVDYVFINPRSTPPGFIRGGATGISGLGPLDGTGRYVTGDPTPFGGPIQVSGSGRRGSIQGEGTFAQTVGSMAHEFGHALGLPDLYDLSFSDPEDDSAGIGRWGLMGWGAQGWTGQGGPVGFSAWSLEQLGWLGVGNQRLVEVIGAQPGLAARDLFLGGVVYKLFLPPRQGIVTPEYLLLERRERDAHYYNRDLPADGVLVWRVRPGVRGNADEGSKQVDLMCADGLYRDAGYPMGRLADAVGGRDNLDFWAHDGVYAREHAGNMGDGSDVFDGVRYAVLNADSNPSLWNPREILVDAMAGPSVRVGRRGQVMTVDAEPLRWAGRLRGEVHWTGDILVDGDLEIAPEGTLYLHGDTRVRLVARDRLRSGLDPERCEVVVQGGLYVVTAGTKPRAEFSALEPGGTWYGIVVDSTAQLEVPEGSIVLRDAVQWLVVPGRLSGARGWGLTLSDYRLLDSAEGENAGNGDGRLQVGESFQVEVLASNWSLTPLDLDVQLSWSRDLLSPTWSTPGTTVSEVRHLVLAPGQESRLRWPSMTLSPDAEPDGQIEFSVQVSRGRAIASWGRVIYPVQPGPPLPVLDLRVPDEALQRQLRIDDPIPVRARVLQGNVASVGLLVRSVTDDRILAEIPMERSVADGSVFDAVFRAPDQGRYELAARVRTEGGGAFLSATRVQLAALFRIWQPVLVVWDGYGGDKGQLPGSLSGALAARGVEANVLDLGSPGNPLYGLDDALLSHYLGPGGAVVWLVRRPTLPAQDAVARYLDSGGRLLMATMNLYRDVAPDLWRKLPWEGLGVDKSLVRFSDPSVPMEFVAYHFAAVGLRSPAEPLLVDEAGRAAAVSVIDDGYRLVVVLMDLRNVAPDAQQRVLEVALGHLIPPVAAARPVIRDVLEVEPLRPPTPLIPRVVVANTGEQPSSALRIAYQVREEGQVVAGYEVAAPPLEPGEEALIPMPVWEAAAEGDYTLHFGLAEAEKGDLEFAVERPVRLVALQGRFDDMPLAERSRANGVGVFDCDGDGDLDLLVVRLGQANLLYRNDGGTLSEAGEEAGVAYAEQGRGLAIGDWDGDGDQDLYLVNEAANRFLRNRGNGRYDDVTAAVDAEAAGDARVGDTGSGRSAGFLDYDADGDLDLLLVNSGSGNRLFRNDLGKFDDVAAALGLTDEANGRGLAIGDWDGDGDPDLFVANQFGPIPSRLYRNDVSRFGGVFANVGEAAGLRFSGTEVSAAFGDWDGDGGLDLFISSQADPNRLWRNLGDEAFAPAYAEGDQIGGRSVGAAFVDYDNDGDLDLATTGIDPSAGGEEIHHHRARSGIVAVGAMLGLRRSGTGRGLVAADYDQDGRQDLAIADYERTTLYHNATEPAHWLEVDLTGVDANLAGLGARVVLRAGARQVREVQSSAGYASQVQPRLHFGLGPFTRVDSLLVMWPDGARSLETGLAVDRRLVLAHPLRPTAVAQPSDQTPGVFRLLASYPNPSNTTTVIPFQTATSGAVELVVYGLTGQRVRVLVDEMLPAGTHQRSWDGRDGQGRPVASGVYIVHLRMTDKVASRRLARVK